MGWKRFLMLLYSVGLFLLPSGDGKVEARRRDKLELTVVYHHMRLNPGSHPTLAHNAVFWGRKNKQATLPDQK